MKILLCNEAYIGDLILSSSVLPVLKRAYPGCKIGALVGSWAKVVFEDHTHIDWIHEHDQICFNRKFISKRKKRLQELKTKAQAHKEIKKIGYDLAIDLHSYYQENSSQFIYNTKIPRRVGYWGTRQPFFYNELHFWDCTRYHMIENHRVMLEKMGIEECGSHFGPCLEYKNGIDQKKLENLPTSYFVLHVGTGEVNREWEQSSWLYLAKLLDQWGVPLVFIGKGRREKERVEKIIPHLKNGLNFSDQFTFQELMWVIQRAKFLVGLESMAGHLAAFNGTPSLLIYAGESSVNWRPYHPFSYVMKPDEKYWEEIETIAPKLPIHMIEPEAVFNKICDILKAHRVLL